MADPVSLLSLAQLGLKTAKTITGLVKEIVDAPDELLALSNEVQDLQLVLEDVKRSRLDDINAHAQGRPALPALLYEARLKLEQLTKISHRWGRLSNHGDSWQMGRRARFLWLKEKSSVLRMLAELREIRSNLVALVGTNLA